MGVRFVLGRAGSGKTRYCLDAMTAAMEREESGGLPALLVPEQSSFQMERALALASRGGGYYAGEVWSFSRLARRVLGEAQDERPVIGTNTRRLAMRLAVERAGKSLVHFGRLRGVDGFYTQLEHLIHELIVEDVSPEALLRTARAQSGWSRRKVGEIARIYESYQGWLEEGFRDVAFDLTDVRVRMAEAAWLRGARVWADGFAGFTGQETAVLIGLARQVRALTITLLVDASAAERTVDQAPDELSLFGRTELTYQALRARFADAGVRCEAPVLLDAKRGPRFVEAPGLGTLEARLGGSEAAASGDDKGVEEVRVLACGTHREEVRQAARYVRGMVLRSAGGLKFRDFAVIARDLSGFVPLIEEVFQRYEIPYFLDRRRPMGSHPLSRFVGALLDAVASDFSTGSARRLVCSGLLPLTDEEGERLEQVIVQLGLCGSTTWARANWLAEDFRLGGALSGGDALDPALDAKRRVLYGAIEPLVLLARSDGVTAGSWARGLHGVLRGLGVRDRLEGWIRGLEGSGDWERAQMHRHAWEALCAVLEDLDGVLGETVLETGDACAMVGAALEETTLGLTPPTLDQVLVSSIERSRHPDVKYAWVLGFNEGVFPQPPAEDLLLSTREREVIVSSGLGAPAPHRESLFDERMLAYIAFTRPSHGLTISYAEVREDGQALQPSPLLREVMACLPGLEVESVDGGAVPVSLEELALEVLDDARRPVSGRRAVVGALRGRVEKDPVLAERFSRMLGGLGYCNEVAALGDPLREVAGAGVMWDASPTEMDAYLQCPFQHFAGYGLMLDAASGPAPLRLDLGTVAHDVLARVVEGVLREGVSVRAVDDDSWRERLKGVWAEKREEYSDVLLSQRPELEASLKNLEGFVEEALVAQVGRWRLGEFEPTGCEQRFGRDAGAGELRRLELTLRDGTKMGVHGKIDRVDVVELNGVRYGVVFDYKSSPAAIGWGPLTGYSLQVLTYLLALVEEGGALRPGGVFIAPLYPQLGAAGTQYFAAADEDVQRMYLYQPRGMICEALVFSLDRTLGPVRSPVANLQLKQDGELYARSDAVAGSDLEALLGLAAATLQVAGEGVAGGCVEVAPLLENRTLACRQCPYGAVCRYDPAFNRSRVAELALPMLGADDDAEGAA